MGLTKKGIRKRANLRRRHGKKKGDRLFYAGERTGFYKGMKRKTK